MSAGANGDAARREMVLAEMGLGPTWRLRGTASGQAQTAPLPADAPDVPPPMLVRDAGADADTGIATETGTESEGPPSWHDEEPPLGLASPPAGLASPPEGLDTSPADPAVSAGGAARRAPPGRAPAAAAPAAKARVSPAVPVVPLVDAERSARIAGLSWEQAAAEVAACRACGLCEGRNRTVFGTGNQSARWMIVGEAPGADEDKLGEPFVGQAGRLLDSMLAAVGRKRPEDVYISNVLKCRPPHNRNPEPQEVAQCSPFLLRQVELVQPALIIAMGRFAAQALLGTDASIASLRGKVHRYQGRPTVVTYHPAYLLRTLTDKARAWEDLCLVMELDAKLAAEAGAGAGSAQ